MSTLSGYDASSPPANPPRTDVVAFYIGGDTPHVWTPTEIAKQTARYRLPIWVRSDPSGAIAPATDAAACTAALKALGAPRLTLVALDLETAIDPTWVAAFGVEIGADYGVLVYGSADNLFKNPRLAGYWLDLPGAKGIPANCVGVQYGQGGKGAWDWDLFDASLSLWDTQPGHVPAGGTMELIAPTPSGNGYWLVSASGAVITRGDAQYLGGPNTSKTPTGWDGPPNLVAGHTCTGIAAHPSSQGYWITDNAGLIYAYGAARWAGNAA